MAEIYARHDDLLSGAALGQVVLEWAGNITPSPGRKVEKAWLDLCCGCGALLSFAQARGYRAMGVDAAAEPLRQAKAIAPNAKLIRDDASAVRLDQRFDIVTCVGGSTNYLLRQNDLLKLFRNARRHLAEGGLFCFDVNTPLGYAVNVDHPISLIGEDHAGFFRVEYNARTQRARWRATGFVQRGRAYRRFDECHDLRGYEAETIDRLCDRAGLHFERLDADSLGAPDGDTTRLVYFCH